MASKIVFGVNLNFAKYVYGRKRALEVAKRQLGVRHVEIDARNVSEIIVVFLCLKEEVPAIIVAIRGAARIMIEYEIGVFIRLSAGHSVF